MANSFSGPYITNRDSIEKNMWNVIFGLIPATIAAVIFFGIYSLYLSLGTALLCVLIEYPFARENYKNSIFGDGSAFLAGMLLGLTLPPASPWWLPIVGAFLTIVIAKQFFGGIGNNIFNPALIARGILLLTWGSHMTSWITPFDGISSATPLANMTTGYWELFLGNVPGSIGETSALALIIGAVYLYIKGYIGLRIPLSYIGSSIIMAIILGIDPVFTVLSGGLLFGALYMATDMVTSPVSKDARVAYGIGCGVLTVIIREFTVYPEGITFAILFMNGASHLWDVLLEGPYFGEVRKRKKILNKIGVLLLGSIIFVGIGFSGQIISENINNQVVTGEKFDLADGEYEGTGEGMHGDIKVEVAVEEGN
ncbi:MAG: RnfABCDGE type electron transport complex subunit D, partial [Bacillota bacterium]